MRVLKTLRLGICGLGTVASGVVNVLNRNRDLITSRAGCSIEIVQVASRRKRDNCDLSGVDFTTDLNAVVNNPDVDVVLELIGGYDVAKDIVETALKAGKHVVTANKALIAEHGNELFSLARENGVIIGYEAGVAGGTCRIAPTEDGLRVTAVLRVPPAGAGEALVIEAGDPGVWVSEPEISREGDILTAEAEMIAQGGAGFALDRSAVRFTLLGSLHAVDIRGCTAP